MDYAASQKVSRMFKGQALLELTLVFVAIVLLLVGTIRMWGWSMLNISERQHPYEASRVDAGRINPGCSDPNLPCYNWQHKPDKLSEKWIFYGKIR